MPQSWMPQIAGLLNVISGAIGILGGLISIVLFYVLINPQVNPGPELHYVNETLVWTLFIFFFMINIIAIIGGMAAIKRKFWGIALAGAICSILSIWGWMLGIASIVFLSLSKKEFGTGLNDY